MPGLSEKDHLDVQHSITLTINDRLYTAGRDVPPWTRLVDFLREEARLTGTKVLCREGGCGVCTVVVTVHDQETPGRSKTFSVQACQVMVYGCAGWVVSTIEHLGSRFEGYHPLQTALHGFYGTQCGYCSPGMIMAMYGQMNSGHPLTSAGVEKSLDGNICRCTGYRPILDAFKSLTDDADDQLKDRLADIEDAYKGCCKKRRDSGCDDCPSGGGGGGRISTTSTTTSPPSEDVAIKVGDVTWYRPTSVQGVYDILNNLGKNDKHRIVVGNTGQGVFKNDGPYSTYLSTEGLNELYSTSLGTSSSPVILGANVSLTRAMEVLCQASQTSPETFAHLDVIAKHWQFVANVSVRNIGCWAGNLMMKHAHRGFQSDIFLTLLSCGAEVTVGHAVDASTSHLTLEQFLEADMSRSIILSVALPPAPPNTKLRTFKITPRAVNAHAYVNACFRMVVDEADGYRVTARPTILLGGINPQFIHASQTEEYLTHKCLSDQSVVVEAAKILGQEMEPDSHPEDASPQYRTSLAQGLLFKTVLSFLGTSTIPVLHSAGPNLQRPLSTGQQAFDMNKETWPVGEPVPKLESATQISGEATYLDDVPYLPNELHAALVLTTQANAKIKSIDATEALKMSGVVTFVTTSDIPGKNSFIVGAGPYPDPVFVEDRSLYAGQAVGVVVANDRDTALRASKIVVVEYEDINKPVLTIKEGIQQGRVEMAMNFCTAKTETSRLGDAEGALQTAPHKVSGELSQGGQFHFAMEPHAARVIPTEDGWEVFSTSQWPTETQATTAQVLNVPANSINVSVRRLGGGYGGKISRQHLVSTATAVAAWKVRQPVRLVTDLSTNMTYSGWREPYYSKYEVGFDGEGRVLALKVDVYSDVGHVANEPSVGFVDGVIQNVYCIPNLAVTPYQVNTDTAANTFCRTPGHVEALATIENIMEHVASYLKMEALEVRFANLMTPGAPRLVPRALPTNVFQNDIWMDSQFKLEYYQRNAEIKLFNKNNRWKKRGLSIVPMLFDYEYPAMFRYGLQVSIYEHDGTVAISHGGIEMGQGLNTKVAQMAAYVLDVPLSKVVVKASDTMIGANSMVTGGSFTSDLCAHGVRIASAALKERIDVVKEKMKKESDQEPKWEDLIKKCLQEDVDLSQRYWTAAKEHPEHYNIWGASCLEVEVDILTGVYMMRRADIFEDCGRSMSPYIDVGQVEGAFLMGLGLYTSELVKYHPDTGQKLSIGTWEYKPPTALDIPADLRVTLLPNAKNPHGVLGSKATGEPPLCMSYCIVTALRQAITAFRTENGDHSWFQMDTPLTVESVHQLCGVNPDMFKLE